jgi:NAD(P)-dependent dehydrogenase (short-subunit alcohol dehydrogenase family)
MEAFRNKAAIVTGGASGIGKALCQQLGRSGADLTVADINGEGAQDVAARIRDAGGRAVAVKLDVTIEQDVRALVEQTAAGKGRLDYMFNNAGIGIGGEVQDLSLDHWRRIVDVNLWGVLYGALAAYQVMIRQGSGHIVNTSSSAGLVPAPLLTAYGMTKHGVLGFSVGLRAEGEGKGVKVSVACPGFIDTPIFDATTYVKTSKELTWSLLPPWLPMMSAEDCARAILKGVARNRGIIPVQSPAFIMWWLNRINPRILDAQMQKMIAKYRKTRGDRTQNPSPGGPGPRSGV